jgi:hypothetical protein
MCGRVHYREGASKHSAHSPGFAIGLALSDVARIVYKQNAELNV